MTILRRITIALLTVALLAPGMARAASTTNFSDQWWIQNESGWGASVLQQSDVLFIDLFVYGPDGKPTWFTAAAFLQGNAPAGHVLFTGDLYSTTGPYFGAGTFNPGAVGYTKVGTLTFDAATVNTARLSYSVNGVPVVKDVTRQTWRDENIGGKYFGGLVYDQTSCADAIDNGHFEVFGELQFNHFADNTVTINARITSGNQNGIPLLVPAGLVFTMSGKYTQSGHMGQMQGTSSLMIPGEPPDTSVVQLFEIESSISGITGRYNSVDDKGGCRSSGHLGGVLR